ncbi:MAG: CHASE2 domain-containing protein [Candidatus Lindowbacteria bacterium]|nr:CHASE2 domain-containing protein [Candidatus Lindowbacteria bacterium]
MENARKSLRRISQRHTCGVVALLGWILTLGIGFTFPRAFLDLENRLVDVRMRLPHRVKPSSKLVYIDIDDRSIAAIGSWPWNRAQMAEIIRTLNRTKPRGILVDILFAEETIGSDDLDLANAFEEKRREQAPAGFH